MDATFFAANDLKFARCAGRTKVRPLLGEQPERHGELAILESFPQ